MVDCGRAEVYAAEAAAFDGTDLESVRPFAEIAALIEVVVAGGVVAGATRAGDSGAS